MYVLYTRVNPPHPRALYRTIVNFQIALSVLCIEITSVNVLPNNLRTCFWECTYMVIP